MSDVTGGSLMQGSLVQDTRTAFNLHDEKDVVTLLRRIHQSPLHPDDKNELRDAVFTFRTSSESALTSELIAKFTEYGFTLSDGVHAVEAKEPSRSVPSQKLMGRFGVTRPSPQFTKVSTPVTSQIPVSVPVVEQTVEPVRITDDVVPMTDTVSAPVIPTVVVPNMTPEPQEKTVPVAHVPSVTTPAQPQEVATPKLVADTAGALARIKEIKKDVNLLVGNPVNLIDVHNEVGREYMNALLDAMKKNNGGTPDQVERAMERLETAFTSVKKTVGVTEITDSVATPAVQESPKKNEVVSEESIDSVASESDASAIPTVPEPVAQTVTKEPVVSGFASVHQTHVEETPSTPKASIVSVSSPVAAFAVSPEEPSVTAQDSIPTTSESIKATPLVPNTGGMMSVAKEKQIQDLMTAERQQAAMTDHQREAIEIASMDPLMTPEVTSGLQQLLSEWSLFKSSGIFGTGPSGMDHQLYKKLANLNMTAVVAGRFEGATPGIKRSITDYMNGWRYEEGILQEQGELFEHYLRRVIKHILDKRSPGLSKTESV